MGGRRGGVRTQREPLSADHKHSLEPPVIEHDATERIGLAWNIHPEDILGNRQITSALSVTQLDPSARREHAGPIQGQSELAALGCDRTQPAVSRRGELL